MAAKSKPNELYIERIYDAPVKMVWEAWTDPEQAAKWWGPRGFTITTHSKELRPGGHWKYTMHGPNGDNYENTAIYYEVEKYQRLVYDHGGSEDRPPLFRVTVVFTDLKNQTKMEMTMALATEEAAREAAKFIKQAGGNSTWDRLAEYLAKEKDNQDIFIINRTFNTSIETMFQLWTDPDHFSKWLPPTGFTMKFIRAEIRPGGSTFYAMTNGSDVTMYGTARYLEIKKPFLVKYTQEFSDKDGNLSRHPMAPTWPAVMLTTVQLTEESPKQTRVTVQWEVHGEANAGEIKTFKDSRAGMTLGWTGSFDKLEEYLSKVH